MSIDEPKYTSNPDYSERLRELNHKRINLAKQYGKARTEYGKAKADIDIIYASKVKEIMTIKRNAGYEVGLLLLIAITPSLKETYQEMIVSLHKYKALDKLLSAYESEIMTIQSTMKYNIKNDGGM